MRIEKHLMPEFANCVPCMMMIVPAHFPETLLAEIIGGPLLRLIDLRGGIEIRVDDMYLAASIQ